MYLSNLFKKIILVVNKIITSLILTIMFLILITPVSILLRVFQKKHIAFKNEASETYWTKINNFDSVKNGFKNQF
jgi:flagellar biosynthesis protein FlhB